MSGESETLLIHFSNVYVFTDELYTTDDLEDWMLRKLPWFYYHRLTVKNRGSENWAILLRLGYFSKVSESDFPAT